VEHCRSQEDVAIVGQSLGQLHSDGRIELVRQSRRNRLEFDIDRFGILEPETRPPNCSQVLWICVKVRIGAVNRDSRQVYRTRCEHPHVYLRDASPDNLPLFDQNSIMRLQLFIDMVNAVVTWPQSEAYPTKKADAPYVK
jgi:hypothetical protein